MIEIRKAVPEDYKALEDISVNSMSEPWRQRDFQSAEKNKFAVTLVAVDGVLPVGYVVGYFAADQSELPSIAVRYTYRRLGVATKLLQALSDEVMHHGAAKMFLEVRESNEAAIALYESNGFITSGTRKNFYSGPDEDALVMMKLL